MYAIKALYDGVDFKPREPIPVNEEYEVVIMFMTPAKNPEKNIKKFTKEEKENIAKSLFGILPSNIDLDKARTERLG